MYNIHLGPEECYIEMEVGDICSANAPYIKLNKKGSFVSMTYVLDTAVFVGQV